MRKILLLLFGLVFVTLFSAKIFALTIEYSVNQTVCGDLIGYDNVTIDSGVAVTVCAKNSSSFTGYWNVTTNSGGVINIFGIINGTGKGYVGGAGITNDYNQAWQGDSAEGAGGQSLSANGGGGGGGFAWDSNVGSGGGGGSGGAGGHGNSRYGLSEGGLGGLAEGVDNLADSNISAGGGGGASSGSGSNGGAGGALVILNATSNGIINLTGTIESKGYDGVTLVNPVYSDASTGGGGAGGIVILYGNLNLLGEIDVSGGSGGNIRDPSERYCAFGGGGGGGRLKFYYSSLDNSTLTTSVSGGNVGVNLMSCSYSYSGSNGSDGTVYSESMSIPNYNITDCSDLNQPNMTYYLMNDIINSTQDYCMNIEADNVTLECQDHIINSLNDGSEVTGIAISSINDIINNCTISDWNNGLTIADYSNATVTNSKIIDNSVGVVFSSDVYTSTFYNNLFNDNNYFDFTGMGNIWNTTEQNGTRIYSHGNLIGGNYYTTNIGDGYSDICMDLNQDGFCDEPLDLIAMTNCTAGVNCDVDTDYLPLSNYTMSTSRTISDCSNLNQAGYTYYLTDDVNASGDCFHISSNDIIFDCQGFSIAGDGTGNGVRISDVDNVTVRNCVVSNFQNGIQFSNSDNSKVLNNTVSFTSFGGIACSYGNTSNCENFLVEDNVLYNTTFRAIVLEPAGNNSMVMDNAVYNCSGNSVDITGYENPDDYNNPVALSYNVSVIGNNFSACNPQFRWLSGLNAEDNAFRALYLGGEYGVNYSFINNTFLRYAYVWSYGNYTFGNNFFDSSGTTDTPFAFIGGYSLSDFVGDEFYGNTVDGLPIYYYFNRSSDLSDIDANTIVCVGCHDMSISDTSLTRSSGVVPDADFVLLLASNLTLRNVSASGHSMCIGSNATVLDSTFSNGDIGFDCYWDYPQPFSYVTFINDGMTNNTYEDIALINSNFTMINTTFDTVVYGDTSSFISRYWYLDLSVNPLSSTVTVIDSKNNTLFSGSSPMHLVGLEYVGFCESPDCDQTTETRDYYTPYTVTATSDYYSPLSESFDLTGSSVLSFDMFTSLNPTGMIISDIGSGIGNFLSAIYLPLGNLILILGVIAGVVAIFMGIAYVIKVAMNR